MATKYYKSGTTQHTSRVNKEIDIAKKYNREGANLRIYNFPNVNNVRDLSKEYKRLAKVADSRLRNLEVLRHKQGFESVDTFAYARALYDIQSIVGGKKRFDVKPSTNYNTLVAQVNAVLSFLNSPTSTTKGIKITYQNKADAINNEYGTNYTWQDFARLHRSGSFKKFDKMYGSKTALRTIGILQHDKDYLIELLNKEGIKYNPSSVGNDDILNLLNKGVNVIDIEQHSRG